MRSLFFCLSALFLSQYAAAQKSPKIELFESKGGAKKSVHKPSGVKFRVYSLEEMLFELDPDYIVRIENKTLQQQRFDFDYKGETTTGREMIRVLNKKLEQGFGYKVTTSNEYPTYYILEHADTIQCKGNSPNYVYPPHAVLSKNVTCVRLDNLAQIIMKWAPSTFVRATSEVMVSQLSFNNGSITEIKKELARQGVTLKIDTAYEPKEFIVIYR